MIIQCVIFDFDGTIKQSVAIKHEAYFSAVAGIERGAEIFSDIIREFPTMTRYSGCALFAERAAALGIETPSGEELAARYSRACEDAIAACPEVPGSYALLDFLGERRVKCFVVSGTPQKPMRETVHRIGLSEKFVDVLGSPTEKAVHYNDILWRTGCAPEALLVIGDGDDDKAAAGAVGAQFVRVRGGVGQPQADETNVGDLSTIPELGIFDFGGAD